MSAYDTSNLTARQEIGYNHTLDVWRPSQTITTGVPSDTTYTRVQTGVPWLAQYTPNIDTVTDVGHFKAFTMLVLDKAHVPADANILNNDLCVVTTIKLDGTRSALYGTQNKMRGDCSYVESVGNREPNKKMLEAMSIDKANATILAYYT